MPDRQSPQVAIEATEPVKFLDLLMKIQPLRGRNNKPASSRAMTAAVRPSLLSHILMACPGFGMLGQNLESLPPLPKDHSQSAQDLVKNSTLNPGTGGSNEKA